MKTANIYTSFFNFYIDSLKIWCYNTKNGKFNGKIIYKYIVNIFRGIVQWVDKRNKKKIINNKK